jgi:hypothetical protein
MLATSDIVFGVFPDPESPDGHDLLLIKGRRRLEAIRASGGSAPAGASRFPVNQVCSLDAIYCFCAEQAEAARQVLGDGVN